MKIDPIAAIGAGAMVIGAIANYSPQQQAITKASDSIQINAVATQVAGESLAAQDALAVSRYESGLCIRSAVSIVEGMAVSRAYANQVICDGQGMTAQIAHNGHLTLLARTGNQTAIAKGLQ